jgi:hypothetical protein
MRKYTFKIYPAGRSREAFFLKKNEIKKTQKNISSDLLKSFAKQPTSEDISEELNKSALN